MKIGLIGTGLMGQPMAKRLLAGKFSVTVYNRTVSKTALLQDAGATIASTVPDLLQAVDVVILMLTDAAAIRQAVLAPESSAWANRIVIQMGTIAPVDSQTIATEFQRLGAKYLEAPVLGSIPQVESSTLLVMAGGDPAVFDRCLPILQQFGPKPQLIGPVGTAAALKLAMNQLIGSLTSAFALSLGLVQRSGVEVETFMEILRQSALYAPTFDKKLSRMVDRYFDHPNFPTKHLLKDLRLFIDAATAVGLETSSAKGVQTILEQAMQRSLADLDYSAVFSVINPVD